MNILTFMALNGRSCQRGAMHAFGTRVGTPNVGWVTPNVVEGMTAGARTRTPSVLELRPAYAQSLKTLIMGPATT